MTTSVTTRAAGTRNPTRQQLDELDALLQRMLELPVHPLDEPEQAESEEEAEELLPPPRKDEGRRMKEEKEDPLPHPSSFILHPSARLPISYMVVETASPRPLPPASGFEPRPSTLTPRVEPIGETPVPPSQTGETPVPLRQDRRDAGPTSKGRTGETPVPPAVPETAEGEMWVPLRSTWQPSAQTWPPLAESWHQVNGGAMPLAEFPVNRPRLLPTSTPVEDTSKQAMDAADSPASQTAEEDTDKAAVNAAASPIAPAVEPRLRLSVEDAPAAAPLHLLPLLWFNQGFDSCLAALGAPGRWLCGPGRQLFGLIGLACLAAALILAACTGMGWTW